MSETELEKLSRLIAYVRDPHPDGHALPDDIRLEIYEVLEERFAELSKRGRGAPGSPTRTIQARMIHELREIFGEEVTVDAAASIALRLTGESDELVETVRKKYQEMHRKGEPEKFPIGPGLRDRLIDAVRSGKK